MQNLMELFSVSTLEEMKPIIWKAYESRCEESWTLRFNGYKFKVLERDCCGPLVVGLYDKGGNLVFTLI